LEEPNLQVAGVPVLIFWMGIRELSSVVLLLRKPSLQFVPSATHGATETEGTAFIGALVFLEIQGKVAGHVVGRSVNSEFLFVPENKTYCQGSTK
jgi:hypothetical protein